jgi:hypothetical protein
LDIIAFNTEEYEIKQSQIATIKLSDIEKYRNVLNDENVPAVRFVEYDFNEIAKEKINENTTDFSYSSTANFGKQIRFIHLKETGGSFNDADCKCNNTETPTVANVATVPTCIVKTDCIENNKNYRYAVFTSDGWYIYSGVGFAKYKAQNG